MPAPDKSRRRAAPWALFATYLLLIAMFGVAAAFAGLFAFAVLAAIFACAPR